MPTSLVTKRFYPRLSELITVDDLPDFLNFAKTGLEALLGYIHYKNLQYSKTARGDGAFYSLDIVSKNIGLDLPFGLRFVLNPDEDGDSTISSFPITLQYQWELLAFLRSVSLQSFAFTPDAFFHLGLQIFKVTDEQVLANTLNFFVDPEDPSADKYDQLVDDINALYPAANLSIPAGQTPTVALIAAQIKQNVHIPVSISELMFAAYLLDADLNKTRNKLQQFYNIIVPDGIEDYIRKLITPKIKASLTLSAGIEFPASILKPVTAAGVPIPGVKSLFKFAEATFYADTESGIGSQLELAGSLLPASPVLHQIGNTGLTIAFTGAKLDLSTTTNIPEADAMGYPVDFVGLYVQHAEVGFTKFGVDNTPSGTQGFKILADNLLIGTGGVSGIIRLEDNGLLHRKFGDFEVELDAFSITFRQNAILGSAISGKIILSKFKNEDGSSATVLIDAMIRDNGDFSVTAKPQNFVPKITLPKVFELVLRSLKLGEKDGEFFIEVAGTLNFIATLDPFGDFLPKNVEITKLVIWQDGHLEFVGGVLPIPKSFTLKVGPVKLEVDHLTISPYKRNHDGADRNYLCIGFDGMLNTGRAGVNVAGNGMKYYFTVDEGGFDQFFSIDGIVIDMTVPGNVPKEDAQFILHGLLNVQQPTSTNSLVATEYTGAISFSMPKLKLSGSAGMRLAPDVPAFVVDIGLELPTAIPLVAALGIYGFRGLIGQHYVPSKQAAGLSDNATWWDYYKAPGPISKKKGIQVDKFGNESGFSIGAGATIGTTFDDGFIFSAKLFIMLGLPKVFLLQGQAGILRSRLALDDEKDPPFSALVAIGDHSFTSNLAVDFKIPDEGYIFSLHGEIDIAFYLNNASGWHINLGQEQPESARIRASILSFVQGYAYLMISAQGIRAGAGASLGFSLGNGIISAGFNVYINLGGHISFKPFQVGGYIEMGGSAYVKILFISLSISVRIGLAVEAPHPANIVGYIEASVKIIFKRISARLDIRLGRREDGLGTLEQEILVLDIPNSVPGYLPAVATNMLTGDAFTINYVNNYANGSLPAPGDPAWQFSFLDDSLGLNPVTIPLDSFIDIELIKPVKPGDFLGGAGNQVPDGYREVFPPDRGINDQVTHEFSLTGLEIYIWRGDATTGQWVDYNIYEAVTAIAQANSEPGGIQLNTLKPGYWQFTDKDRYNKIRLMSQDMFSYTGKTDISLPGMDALNFSPKDLFCFDHILKLNVVDWVGAPVDAAYPSGQEIFYDGINFFFSGVSGAVAPPETNNENCLKINGNYGTLLITLPEALSQVNLDFGMHEHHIGVNFLSTVYAPFFFNEIRPFTFNRQQNTLALGSTDSRVVYDNLAQPVDKILITFDGRLPSDYVGDLTIGGHVRLLEAYGGEGLTAQLRNSEMERSLINLTLYSRSLTEEDVLGTGQVSGTGVVADWRMDKLTAESGNYRGFVSGSPDMLPELYLNNGAYPIDQLNIFSFSAISDAFIVPFQPALKVENDSFAFKTTLVFDPFVTGVSTLWSKLTVDNETGLQKGYSLHLCQQAPVSSDTAYPDPALIPQYSIWLICYDGPRSSGFEVKDNYSIECGSTTILSKQYKQVAFSVNRTSGMLDIYLDSILKTSVTIPAELAIYEPGSLVSYLKQISYMTPGLQARAIDNGTSEAKVINEVEILSNALNKTIQPIWRPNSIFAIRIHTQDLVTHPNYELNHPQTHTFGFKTAGPLGHFHQHNKNYKNLFDQDRAGEFKLANLKAYIDYNRSFPDALGRYDLSKPVYWQMPQVKLYFTESYMNAMFADWNNYQGLNPIHSEMKVTLIDPSKQEITQQLVWTERSIPITLSNFRTLPPSQQMVFLFNLAAAGNSCNPMPNPVVKKVRQASYQFPDLIPGKFYTAILTSYYTTHDVDEATEIHRFSFQTSLYKNLQEQVDSIIADASPTNKRYAVTALQVTFTQNEINERLKILVDATPDNDPLDTLHYAVPFERIVYGGLKLLHLEPVSRTTVLPVINTDPDHPESKQMLGILISSPEPFNDPKFTASQLLDTVGLTLNGSGNMVSGPGSFIYFHSRNTSSIFISNAAMIIPAGSAIFSFKQKVFNGIDYDLETCQTESIDLSSYLVV